LVLVGALVKQIVNPFSSTVPIYFDVFMVFWKAGSGALVCTAPKTGCYRMSQVITPRDRHFELIFSCVLLCDVFWLFLNSYFRFLPSTWGFDRLFWQFWLIQHPETKDLVRVVE
jgi:hypothetical protein